MIILQLIEETITFNFPVFYITFWQQHAMANPTKSGDYLLFI